MSKQEHIVWHDQSVSRSEREEKQGHPGLVLWFTGLSGSGKSTLANALDRLLFEKEKRTYVLDGDNVRHGLNQDLGFTAEDRQENIRRISEVAKLFADAGTIVSTAFISPYAADREQAKQLIGEETFVEVFVQCDLDTCEERDPKGLYRKARTGEIPSFTGISAPYEEPEAPKIVVNTAEQTVEETVQTIIQELQSTYNITLN
ncbi:adenylyl-sulfate kinase [Salsuginibacillus kocurii]|uniref:adenylyl-sulfate kinase n=1 Tax=Salsuginibacillus kocurii TaxID=427078 RepID=UPI0003682C34|nr:adenylyl-sulfate kinase [Salsuginibacillus kocurii]